MARVTESSFITTLRAVEAREREDGGWGQGRPGSEQRSPGEQRLAEAARRAEERARSAEQDRVRAEERERQQHEARLRALTAAAVESARSEAEARHERERLTRQHEHERTLLSLDAERRLRSWRRAVGASGFLLAIALASVAWSLAELRLKQGEVARVTNHVATLEQSLAEARSERDRAREERAVAGTRLALLEAKLDAAARGRRPPHVTTRASSPSR